MALVKCEECGKQISDEAESCPSCGAKPEKMGLFRKIFIGIFAFVVLSFMMKESNPPSVKQPEQSPSSSTETQEAKKKREEDQAKQLSILLRISALREEMNNPPSFELVEAINLANGTLCVTYRATNGFGGVVTDSKAISSGAKVIDYAKNCNGKTGEDVTHLKKYLKKL